MKEDRRIQKTKAAITNAFFTLLKEKDFTRITINDIAEKANVNRGTIYTHYQNKYDLLGACIEEKLQLLKEVCLPIRMDASASELFVSLESVYKFFNDNFLFFSLMLQNGGSNNFQARFKESLIEEMRRLTPAKGSPYDHEFFTQFRASALVGVVEWWIRENKPLSVDEMAENTVTLFLKNR